MSRWSSAKARDVLRALERIGWQVKRQSGSHKTLAREDMQTSCSPSTIAMRLVRKCLRVLPSTQVWHLRIYRVCSRSRVLQRTVTRRRRRGASASLHCALARRWSAQRAAAELRRFTP